MLGIAVAGAMLMREPGPEGIEVWAGRQDGLDLEVVARYYGRLDRWSVSLRVPGAEQSIAVGWGESRDEAEQAMLGELNRRFAGRAQ